MQHLSLVHTFYKKYMFFTFAPVQVQGLFERFVDWQQCATVMQMEVVTVMPSCGGGNVMVA
jgi:hypothetical protein